MQADNLLFPPYTTLVSPACCGSGFSPWSNRFVQSPQFHDPPGSDAVIFSNSPLPGSPVRPTRLEARWPEPRQLYHCHRAPGTCQVSFPTTPLINWPHYPKPAEEQAEPPSCTLVRHKKQLRPEPVLTLGKTSHDTLKTWFPPVWCRLKLSQGELQMSAWIVNSREQELSCLCSGMCGKGMCRSASLKLSRPCGKSNPWPHMIIPFSFSSHCAAGCEGTLPRHQLPLRASTDSYPQHVWILKVLHNVSLHFIFSYTTGAVVCILITFRPQLI